jgi:hypothetical protein
MDSSDLDRMSRFLFTLPKSAIITIRCFVPNNAFCALGIPHTLNGTLPDVLIDVFLNEIKNVFLEAEEACEIDPFQ